MRTCLDRPRQTAERSQFPRQGLLAVDRIHDLAILKLDATGLRTVKLGDSDAVQVGQGVVAIGNPLSLESTVSNGIVSGVRDDSALGGRVLQITAPIPAAALL